MKKNRQKSEIRRGFSIANAISLIIFMLLFTFLQFMYMDDIFLFVQKRMMIEVADEIASLDYDSAGYLKELSDIESTNSIYVEIYSPRDKLIYTTDSNQTVYNNNNNNEEITLRPRIMKFLSQQILDDGSYFEVRQELYATAQFLVYGTFLASDIGMEIYYPTELIKDNANTASWALFALTFAIILIVLLIVYTIAKMYLDPLQKIKTTTQKMAQLDFNETCPPFKNKQMDELSDNINFLSCSLSNALQELKSKNKQLERDIEAERRQAKARRSFVANASHELKTPISIIQGYAEGMKYGIGCDSTEEFCDIIIEESQKMNSLIVRLIEQLQYSSSYNLNETNFNIRELVNELIESRRLNFEESEIKLTVEVDENCFVYADRELLSSVFNNYLSNAMSHIDFEKELKITCKEFNNHYRICVFNSGKPIAGTDIENIWQSFYRADKSHSRKEGRFGLGLSIVATIQDLHKQKYGVMNHNNGVEFWFDIKKA